MRGQVVVLLWAATVSQTSWGAMAVDAKHHFRSPLQAGPSRTGSTSKAEALVAGVGRGQLRQRPDVSHESWFERLGNAFWSVIVGLVIWIPFSISLLWVNERRNAQLDSVVSLGSSEVQTVDVAQGDLSKYDGVLVHLSSEIAKGLDQVDDDRFAQVKKESGILRLRSSVQVYQWEEKAHTKKEKDSVGGGETTVKTYSHNKAWCDSIIDSNSFHRRHGHENTVHVQNLDAGVQEKVNSTVKYGEQYYLGEDLVVQLQGWESAAKLLAGELKFHQFTFQLATDGYHYCPANVGAPQIGDFRVKIEYVPDGPASILALQTEDKQHEGCKSFAPYRSISRSFFANDTDGELKQRRLDAAKKTGDDFYRESKCLDFGPFACLCGCCNLITYMFTHSSATIPQLYGAWSGAMSVQECFDSVKSTGMAWKWGLRLVGFILLWAGFMMLFAPLEVIIDIVPFIGPYLGSGFSFIMSLITFLLTLALAAFIVSCAYMVYHPLMGMVFVGLSGGVVALILIVNVALSAKQ